jgi:hypothetical protein
VNDKVPSVKGSLIAVGMSQLNEQRRSGLIRDEDLDEALGPEYAELVTSGNVAIASWYPADLYDRMLSLMMHRAGGGKPEYLVEQGRRAVSALEATGIYQQLACRGGLTRGFVRLLLSLSSAMYNFTTWDLGALEPDQGWFELVISGAARYPDTFRWRNVGFIEAVTERATGRSWRVTSERKTPDRIHFLVREVSAERGDG